MLHAVRLIRVTHRQEPSDEELAKQVDEILVDHPHDNLLQSTSKPEDLTATDDELLVYANMVSSGQTYTDVEREAKA